jgi:Ca2+-transporting ATPase
MTEATGPKETIKLTKPSHTSTKDIVLKSLSSNEQTGLTASQVTVAREKHGWNELATVAPEPAWKKFLAQFSDVMVWILIAAAVISGAMCEWTDTAAIVIIVVLNAFLGFYQEGKAEKSLAALQSLAAPKATVVREEKLASILARDLVPGDIIEIKAGDHVPADVRLLTTFAVKIEEASLTGESVPVEKDAKLVLPESTPLADRRNMAYTTTVLANGHGRGIVVGTGMNTEIGRIAGMLQTYDREPTPLQRQLAKLGRTLVIICLLLVGVIFLLGLLRGKSWLESIFSSVSLAVAAVPEGMPAVVTTALALGLQRMAKRNALVQELPFDADRKAMSVLVKDDCGHRVQYTKGATSGILEKCVSERRNNQVIALTDERRREIAEANVHMASDALRVLALAYRDDDGEEPLIDENNLTFAGLVGMIDPPREEVKQSIVRCREAGIRPVMITGDHPATATAIAKELGIALESDRVVTGQELDAMSDDDLATNVEHIAVYARVAPEHKLRVVRAWKARGEIVAMTGDGVNDAPAVKAANIGIAMGITGTDVTRQAAAMVLMDDNFVSIVNAVEEGRAIYDNIHKFLIYLLSCNAGELMLMLSAGDCSTN